MHIAREGWKFIFGGLMLVVFGLGGVAGATLRGKTIPGVWAVCIPGAVIAIFCAFFFRDPERPLPADATKIYSPGDGRVLSVAREGPGDITTVRIFLSLFDVHVQRLPCSGQVTMVRHQPGSFKLAMKPEANQNERTVVRIQADGHEPVVVEQIAGFIARRIVCRLREGDRAVAGERYGLIHFGSQAAVHLPKDTRPLVKPGDYAVGGVTAIAQWTRPG